jgi:hypothetical protein
LVLLDSKNDCVLPFVRRHIFTLARYFLATRCAIRGYWVERRKQKADVDAELETYRQRVYRVEAKSYQESTKHERYCRKPRELLRTLEELTAHERVMYELDNRKDHIMTGGLAGLGESGDVGA